MGFKAEKVSIDLEADLTEYIPGDDGKLNSEKKTAKDLFEWAKFSARKGDEFLRMQSSGTSSSEEILVASKKSAIEQINWFYDKDDSYWDLLPLNVIKGFLSHLQEQVLTITKK